MNLVADFSLSERTQLYGRVEKLCDADYEEVFTIARPVAPDMPGAVEILSW